MARSKVLVGRNAAMALDGYDITNRNNSFKAKRDAAVIDATTFGQRFSYDLAGIQKASIEWKGFYEPGQTGYDQIINARFGQDSDVYAALAPGGWGSLNNLIMQPSVLTKYDIDGQLKGAVDVDLAAMARGAVDDGFQLFYPTNLLTGASGVSDVWDNGTVGGSSTAGGAAQLHVIGLVGTTPGITITVQDSPDNAAWTDQFLFAAVTLPNVAQRLTIDIGNPLNRYMRAKYVTTGTGVKATILCGASRNVTFA